jgi:hypothetical protein
LFDKPRSGRGRESQSSSDAYEVSDLQSDGERNRGQRGRTERHFVHAVKRRDRGNADHDDRDQAENPIARAEQRTTKKTYNRYHALNFPSDRQDHCQPEVNK